ncbi:E3 ubiquitin-protein ligase MIB2-like, partial [Actinia tenebrosa]|uniref:E3 ubiquitin-protein ligase MIB2-like n=1 Tax=Actinia tenebrosa TaxID=6105 RepID=A0A6P8HDH5_ACTTE
MYLLGCRVVRGPDWTWGDQDGGEGGVGTIFSTDTFSDGSPLKNQTVVVCWDTGQEAYYRLGLDEKYDLRILDSAPSGVCFEKVICDGCRQNPLLGTRWKCTDCDDYDLCTQCYNNEVHDLDHSFERHDHCKLQRYLKNIPYAYPLCIL